jgi:NADPH2:quinone reductase
MKAILCYEHGPPSQLRYESVPDPIPADDELVVKIVACGVNFPDTLIIQGLYQIKPALPFSPGGDIAGVVESVGSSVSTFKPGDAVVAMKPWGGFAEKVAVKADETFHKPAGMSMVQAASFTFAYGTSYHALVDRGQLGPGDTLLVLGASGGVGLTAVEIGKQLGARVIAAASTEAKLAICKARGADELINYSHENLKERVKALTGGKGADVIYDPVGGDYSEAALRAIAWEGRFLVVGFASGQIPRMPLNLALLKGCQIVGVFWGSFSARNPAKNLANIQQLMSWFEQDQIEPHIHQTYPLEEAARALEALMNRTVSGKAIVVM